MFDQHKKHDEECQWIVTTRKAKWKAPNQNNEHNEEGLTNTKSKMKQESINKNTKKLSQRNSKKKHKTWKNKKKRFFYEWELWHIHGESHLKPEILNPIPTLQP